MPGAATGASRGRTTSAEEQAAVVVLGAGISGLAAAWSAAQAGARVVVLEAGDRVGGVITTDERGGYLAELGPTSMMETPAVAALVHALGLDGERLGTAPAARRRYVLKSGRLLPVPMSPIALLASPLLSPAGRVRALGEPFVRRSPDGAPEESLASLVRRRFGREVLDYLVDPFVSGVYAGDPERLSARHALAQAADLERRHGSVLVGAVRSMRAARRAGVARPHMMSFRGGLRRLPDALAATLGDAVRLGARATSIRQANEGWLVEYEDANGRSRVRASSVIVATPAHALASLDLPPALAAELAPVARVRHAAVATVALGFRRDDVAHALDGFGMLAPSGERCAVLGALFNSSLFPGRAPDGHVLLTCFVGGTRAPSAALEGHDALVRRAVDALRPLLGVRGEPTVARSACWAQAIPQYEMGHDAVVAAAARAEAAFAGFFLAGSWRRGVSVGDCVALGTETGTAAAKVGTVRLRTASIAQTGPRVA